jgi:hypothetical protein
MTPRAVRQQNMVMSPAGLGTKNHSADEDRPTYVVQLWTVALSNGPNRACVFRALTWGRKQIQFPKRCVLQNTERWTKSKNPAISSVIHHRQNPYNVNDSEAVNINNDTDSDSCVIADNDSLIT